MSVLSEAEEAVLQQDLNSMTKEDALVFKMEVNEKGVEHPYFKGSGPSHEIAVRTMTRAMELLHPNEEPVEDIEKIRQEAQEAAQKRFETHQRQQVEDMITRQRTDELVNMAKEAWLRDQASPAQLLFLEELRSDLKELGRKGERDEYESRVKELLGTLA